MTYLNYLFILYSTIVKAFSAIRIPVVLRPKYFTVFGTLFLKMKKEDFEEIKKPLKEFNNTKDFFSREIDLSFRPLTDSWIGSPCDGIIKETGKINSGSFIRVKGHNYNVDELVLDNGLVSMYQEGSYMVIYLSPSNYHRFHIPINGVIDNIKEIPAMCFPVNDLGTKLAKNVYAVNERVVVNINNNGNKICMVIVGACAVRGIKILKKKGERVNKGEELGCFELGSSIVLISNDDSFIKKDFISLELKARGSLF
jgi:phosphatidylserine decarboxylase